jgi:hypothetical protein
MTISHSIIRVALSVGIATATVGTVSLLAPDAAADTVRPEFVVGTELTAKQDHALVGRSRVKAGAKGKVTKVHNSAGKIVALDVAFGELKASKMPVARVRELYSYLKL